jgi:hypothetical protein
MFIVIGKGQYLKLLSVNLYLRTGVLECNELNLWKRRPEELAGLKLHEGLLIGSS